MVQYPIAASLSIETILRAKRILDSLDTPHPQPIYLHPAMYDRVEKFFARQEWYDYWRAWRAFRSMAERGLLNG